MWRGGGLPGGQERRGLGPLSCCCSGCSHIRLNPHWALVGPCPDWLVSQAWKSQAQGDLGPEWVRAGA